MQAAYRRRRAVYGEPSVFAWSAGCCMLIFATRRPVRIRERLGKLPRRRKWRAIAALGKDSAPEWLVRLLVVECGSDPLFDPRQLSIWSDPPRGDWINVASAVPSWRCSPGHAPIKFCARLVKSVASTG